MPDHNADKKLCFGILETVFPKGPDSIRETPENCLMHCPDKTQCLKEALQNRPEGLAAQEEFIDRAYKSGMISFWERWLRKKNLRKKIIQMKKKPCL